VTTARIHPIAADRSVTIRPIRATDTVMEGAANEDLSVVATHFRFLGGIKELSQSELKRLCNVGGQHSMAFVATVQCAGREDEIGVSRYVEGSSDGVREMAIAIRDEWQQKGLGELLIGRLIAHARSCGVKRLYSVDFADNLPMRALAATLGMQSRRDPGDANRVIYSLTL